LKAKLLEVKLNEYWRPLAQHDREIAKKYATV